MPEKPHSIILETTAYRVRNNNIQVYIDTCQILNMPNYKDNLEINEQLKKGASNPVEYSNSVKNSYKKYYIPSKTLKQSYLLIISNKTDSMVTIQTKEGWLFMIQEALDKNGNWKPIEYYEPFAFCGNSFGTSYLLPNHYMISKIYKYNGNFKTKLRSKVYNK